MYLSVGIAVSSVTGCITGDSQSPLFNRLSSAIHSVSKKPIDRTFRSTFSTIVNIASNSSRRSKHLLERELPCSISVQFSSYFLHCLVLRAFAQAGEGLFSRAYTSETVPQGNYEIEQLVRERTGRVRGDYNAVDLKSEVEYGITDKLQVSYYVNTGYIKAAGASDDDDPDGQTAVGFTRNRFYLQSLATEFLYRIWSPVTDPIGIAVYMEPEYYFNDPHNGRAYDISMSNEYRIIFQKNFLEDQLVVVYNAVLETEFIRFEGEENWKGELDFNNELGITYRIGSNWYGGLEARNHNELGNYKNHEHSVYWAGPVAHYAGEKYWATLGVLAQVYGTPNGVEDAQPDGARLAAGRDNLFLRSHEAFETTFKIGFPF